MTDMDEVYRAYSKMIYHYLLTKTREPGLAEELTQETFFRAIQSIHRYDGNCRITTWLCQIANHIWLQELRKRSHLELDEELPAPELGPEELTVASDEKVRLYRRIRQLAEPVREVMYLRLSGELSFKEIGEIMGQSENWARVTFYRGKQKVMKGAEL